MVVVNVRTKYMWTISIYLPFGKKIAGIFDRNTKLRYQYYLN